MRLAAMIMYQRARKLGSLRAAPEDFLAISELQLEAYAVSINSLSLVDEKCAWFTMPVSSENSVEVRFEVDSPINCHAITCDSPGNVGSFQNISPRTDTPWVNVTRRL